MAVFTYTAPVVGGSSDTWGTTLNQNWADLSTFLGSLDSTELAVLDGITASTAELNLLDGVLASTAEINYLGGVTSAVQTQIDAKMSTASFPDLVAIEALSSTGIAVRTGSNTYAQRSIVAGANITVTNGNGAAGDITIAVTAAAPPAFGALGTYVWALRDSTSIIPGSTYAGSGLYVAGVGADSVPAVGWANANASAVGRGSTSLSGTWMAMGGSPSARDSATLFIRVS